MLLDEAAADSKMIGRMPRAIPWNPQTVTSGMIADRPAADLPRAYKRGMDVFKRLPKAASGPIPAHIRTGPVFEKPRRSAAHADRLNDIHEAHGPDMSVDAVRICRLAAPASESYRTVRSNA